MAAAKKPAKRGREKAAGTKAQPEPPKVPGPRGGMLYRGGKPGNRGGGRPPEKVRAETLKVTAKAIARLAKLLDNPDAQLGARDLARIASVGAKIAIPALPQAVDLNVKGQLLVVRDISELEATNG